MPTYIRDGNTWKEVGSGGGGLFSGPITANTQPFFRNPPTIAANYTVTTAYNEMSIGPMTINNGITVTVSNGATWTIV
jgi:hypothetical protein